MKRLPYWTESTRGLGAELWRQEGGSQAIERERQAWDDSTLPSPVAATEEIQVIEQVIEPSRLAGYSPDRAGILRGGTSRKGS